MTNTLTTQITTQVVRSREHLHQQRRNTQARQEHDQVIADPRMHTEHLAARDRAVSSGQPDCVYCQS